jgi:hypothetical protein
VVKGIAASIASTSSKVIQQAAAVADASVACLPATLAGAFHFRRHCSRTCVRRRIVSRIRGKYLVMRSKMRRALYPPVSRCSRLESTYCAPIHVADRCHRNRRLTLTAQPPRCGHSFLTAEPAAGWWRCRGARPAAVIAIVRSRRPVVGRRDIVTSHSLKSYQSRE